MSRNTKIMTIAMLAGVSAMAVAHGAFAQAAAPAQVAAVEQVVVTGSRLATAGFTAPTPVTIVGAAQVAQRSPALIGELINDLPAFRQTSGPTNVTNGILATAQSLLNLRGLGATRTLVLVDGLRHVPVNTTGTFDTNLIPTSLIDRTEVVTGGASAAYGSDAVAGVVNLVLKNKLDGLTGNVQWGLSQRGDNVEPLVALAWGRSFMNDRLHVMIGGDYNENHGVGTMYVRDWGKKEPGALTLSASRGNQANQIISNFVELDNVTPGGIITAGPLKGVAFRNDGTPYNFQYTGLFSGATEQVDPAQVNYGNTEYSRMPLRDPYERTATLAKAQFEITPDLVASMSYNYGALFTHTNSGTCCANMTYLISRDNAFLPAPILNAMIANNLQTISVGRRDPAYPTSVSGNRTETHAFAAGLKGKVFTDWTWDIGFTNGLTDGTVALSATPRNADQAAAVYAVRNAQGQITCGPVATNPNFNNQAADVKALYIKNLNTGCVPYNMFGAYGGGQENSYNYFVSKASKNSVAKQTTAEINLAGSPMTLPAGEVSLAVGAGWRKDEVSEVGCDDCLKNALFNQNFPTWGGSNTVKELYSEVGVPLLKDVAFFQKLDFNAAVRRTSYQISGDVTTWKAGGTWDVNDALRFRITRSRDIRAPNLSELFNPGATGRGNVINKANGNSGTIASGTTGSPTLVPEIADTLTGGVVFQPKWGFTNGFRLSVDYYNIDIAGVIGSISTQDVLDRLLVQKLSEYEQYVTRDNTPLGFAKVVTPNLNLNSQKVDGIDIEASDRIPLDSFNLPGRLEVRALASWLDDLRTIQVLSTGAVSDQDSAGFAPPEWQGSVDLTYTLNALTVNLNTKLKSATLYQSTAIGPDNTKDYNPANTNSINQNQWPASIVYRLNASYDIRNNDGKKLQVYGVIDNLMDKDPPIIAITNLGNTYYDMIGRSFKVGVRFQY